MLILTACASRTNTVGIDKRIVCVAFEPIPFSRLHDTAPTIAAVKEHNRTYDAVCPPPEAQPK
jgi:hypothetical protein